MRYILDPREAAALAPACATRLHCVTGLLWLVGQRDGADRLLAAGESADLPAGQRHYLSSLGAAGPAAFELSVPAERLAAGAPRAPHLPRVPLVPLVPIVPDVPNVPPLPPLPPLPSLAGRPRVRPVWSALAGLLQRLRHLL